MIKKSFYAILFISILGFQAARGEDELRDVSNLASKNVALLRKDISVINLWASWCQPCREEMPVLSKFSRLQARLNLRRKTKVNVIGIAFDQTENIRDFLRATPLHYPVWRYEGTESTTFMATFGNHAGALPYTVVDAPACNFRQPFFGKVTWTQLTKATEAAQQACAKLR